MILFLSRGRLESLVADAVKATVEQVEGDAERALKAHRSLGEVQKKLAEMEIQQGKKQEGWDRREREIEHKVGLERKRQEFEIAQATREATVKVQQENLAADKERFKGEMEFQRKHLENEVKGLRELVAEMLKRLPSAEIIARMGSK